jgi:DNA processing protein
MSSRPGPRACERCLARPWLLARLAGHLDVVRGRIGEILELPDTELIEAVAGEDRGAVRRELGGFDPAGARERAARAGLELVCRCDPSFPDLLKELPSAPAVLHISCAAERFADLVADLPAAIVGARRASDYGLEIAGMLARGLAAAGVTVLSGMALGIDSAAHAGAIQAGGTTVAVLPGGADRPYPASKAALRRQVSVSGALMSELPPGTAVRRWMFPARNRIIAALAEITIVVEATERSGALITAAYARSLGRSVGAVPGRVGAPCAAGPNGLLARAAAVLITSAQDVLDIVHGPEVRLVPAGSARPPISGMLRRLLDAISDGLDTPAALARAGAPIDLVLADLAKLELAGYVRRGAGGRITPVL